MTIAPTVDNGAGAGAGTGATLDKDNFGLKFDEFLKLLTTQLQNQDPTAPMDSEKFTRQLTQFAAVEQAIRTNSQLEKLLDMTRASQILSAAGYVGQEVEFRADRIYLPASGDAVVSYSLPRSAAEVRLAVFDSDGELLAERRLPGDAGPHRQAWDGRTDAGVRLGSGEYRVTIEASDADGRPVPVSLRTAGIVEAVEFAESGLRLVIDGVPRPVDSIAAIRTPRD